MLCSEPIHHEGQVSDKAHRFGTSITHFGFAGVMLADDRKTVIAHLACDAQHRCTNFDTGAVTIVRHGRPVVVRELTQDMSESAVKKIRSKVAHCLTADES